MTEPITVPLLDLKAQYATIRDEIREAVDGVLESQMCILGKTVSDCEASLAEYCSCPHAIAVSSGSDALLVSLMAEEIGPGDEVITTPYTFFATVGAIARLGATPVFVDIDPKTYNINSAGVAERITPKTKAIIPVHLYGQCADMDPIMAAADAHNIPVIEDAAQAIGSEYKGRRAGSIGRYGCFSFFPSKNLGAAGDGGLVTTRDDAVAEKLRILRMHGSKPKYYHSMIGGNFRCDALQAAIVAVKLRHLDKWTAGRQSNAARYRKLFESAGLSCGTGCQPVEPCGTGCQPVESCGTGCQPVEPCGTGCQPVLLPIEVAGGRHIYNQFVVRVPRRDELRQYLAEQKVGNEVYYPVPLHLQKCFEYLGCKQGDFPESEKAALETIALPIYPELSDAQAGRVVECIAKFYGK